MSDDNLESLSYAQLMGEERPFITVVLELEDPVELGDFVEFFASIGDQYTAYIRENYPLAQGEPRVFVKEMRQGSIIADLFPGGVGDLIAYMDSALIVTNFVALLFGEKIRKFILGGGAGAEKKSDLKNYLGVVKAVANNSDGRAIIQTTSFEKGIAKTKIEFAFTVADARVAAKNIEMQKQELDKVTAADHERVLMYFKRSDSGDAEVGKRSGERVIIEKISDRDLPLIYASELSENEIKDTLRNADRNVYKTGFVVDVNVQTRGGKPIAYAITHLHQIIDLDID